MPRTYPAFELGDDGLQLLRDVGPIGDGAALSGAAVPLARLRVQPGAEKWLEYHHGTAAAAAAKQNVFCADVQEK